jgi:uracil-DNA glycosylase family 4
MLPESERRAYLEALGVDVWALRGSTGADDAVAAADPDQTPCHDELTPAMNWTDLRAAVSGCTRCALHKSRNQTVFGVGNESADWMIVGEAPGAEEDRCGEPFVGPAGQLLDEMLRSVGLSREGVFIANTLKCRPPGNRDPAADEAIACRAYLDRQIALIAPKLVLVVGRIAAQLLLRTDAPLGRLRGQKHYLEGGQTPVVVTYHPAYLLRSPTQKGKVWEDLCMARSLIKELSA